MKNRLRLLTVAAGVLLWGFAAMEAKAAPVLVTEDGGTYNWTLTSDGAGHVSIAYDHALLTTINNVSLGTAITANLSTETINSVTNVGPPFWVFSFTTTGSPTKTFGDTVGSQAELGYSLAGGSNASALDGFLNVIATMPNAGNPILDALPGYTFSPFSTGGQMIMTYNQVGTDVGMVINNGGTVSGTGGFTELASAVPEPASLALLGIGMTGFLAFRRFFKKTSVA